MFSETYCNLWTLIQPEFFYTLRFNVFWNTLHLMNHNPTWVYFSVKSRFILLGLASTGDLVTSSWRKLSRPSQFRRTYLLRYIYIWEDTINPCCVNTVGYPLPRLGRAFHLSNIFFKSSREKNVLFFSAKVPCQKKR